VLLRLLHRLLHAARWQQHTAAATRPPSGHSRRRPQLHLPAAERLLQLVLLLLLLRWLQRALSLLLPCPSRLLLRQWLAGACPLWHARRPGGLLPRPALLLLVR
jgi:hypothetical protein